MASASNSATRDPLVLAGRTGEIYASTVRRGVVTPPYRSMVGAGAAGPMWGAI